VSEQVAIPVTASLAQERIWLLEQLLPGTPVHNVPILLRLSGSLDTVSLQQALDAVIAAHESLRMGFTDVEGSLHLRLAAPERVELEVCDASSSDAVAGDAVDALLVNAAGRGFDLSRPPYLRALRVRISELEHLLLLVTHEIACDSSSAPVLVHDLVAAYDAAVRGVAFDPLVVQYSDLTAVAADELESEVAHWRAQLEGAPALLEFPTDYPRPAVQSFRAGRETTLFPAAVSAAVETLAARTALPRRSVLLAGLAAVLGRYSGHHDLVFGTFAESPVGGDAHVLGPRSKALPVRVDLAGSPSFSEFANRVGATLAAAESHAALPFEQLLTELNPQRDLSRSPVFQSVFAFEPEAPAAEVDGVRFEQLELARTSIPFDLMVTLRPAGSGLEALAHYSIDLYEPATIRRILSHLGTLLTAAASDSDRPLESLPILTAGESRHLLVDVNATAGEYPSACLHELVQAQAEKTPLAIAVADENSELSYAELELRANQLAHHLRSFGVGSDDRIGICLERSVDLVVALLAVLKTGAAYVPIDPDYPAERQAFMLADAQVPVLVSEERLVARFPDGDAEIVCLDRDSPTISRCSAEPPPVATTPDQLAYVIYTSGSTGKPKGVEIRHRSVVNLVTHMRSQPGCGAEDVVVNVTTPAFDLSVPDWYLPLVCGARLVIVPSTVTLDGAQLADWLLRTGATFAQATPTTWRLLVESGWQGSEQLKIVCGGEALPRTLAHDLLDRGAELWHMYGPTETTVWSSILRLTRGEGLLPLGGPITNTSFYVLDERLAPVPTGVPGQLHIGGDGVARGYRNRPELTAEKFIPNPFDVDADRLYATGDLVRYRNDGALEFLGRIDHQVKLRGFRIELGEVESVLAEHPAVASAVAVVREDSPGDRRLVAYVVGEGGEAPPFAELRRFVQERLPLHMVPSALVRLESLPTNANRKVDRAALPAPETRRPELESVYVAARTPVEKLVAQIWGSVLGLDRIGIDDDFFELGGNSLLATQVASRLSHELAASIPLRLLFELPAIRDLAAGIVRLLAETTVSAEEISTLLEELEDEPVQLVAGRGAGRKV
jgi:amino acid adenylation domain-containing protein